MAEQTTNPNNLKDKLSLYLSRRGAFITQAERKFIQDMQAAASQGVGYGWMQQIIEWEWQGKSIGSWGPEYFERRIKELEGGGTSNKPERD